MPSHDGAAAEGAEAEAPVKGRAKVEKLLEIQKEQQKRWEAAKRGEADPDPDKPKYMITFPYPYMNGKLHLGHAFSFTKAEFAARFKTLQGYNVLFPFGFHCTGMPIAACADKLKREIKLYGNPPVFPPEPEEPAEAPAPAPAANSDPTKHKGKKTKVAQKAGKAKTQWEIMKMLGLSDKQIPKFQNAEHWLQYFPPPAKVDLKKFGSWIDWRRSFITTEANPYYDSFIRWQFNTLKSMDKVVFGNRPSVFSTVEQQQCADHDRSKGEGVGPQEYTVIKIEITELTGALSTLQGKRVFLAAATLRPETMYGQTNCWIKPSGEYGVFELNDDECIVTSERAALNMSYQGNSQERGKPVRLLTVMGKDLMGLKLKAPLCPLPVTYCLPMDTIKMDKGTGVVTSVPSDSPADYITFTEIKKKIDYYKKEYGVQEEWIMPFECIDIIDTPSMGGRAAEAAIEEFKIQSSKDFDKLEKAKEKVYKEGFYSGVMNDNCGEHAGMKVEDAKLMVRQKMLDNNEAFLYWEPESEVISRSGVECVVALTDQWSMRYGEEKWRAQIEEHIKNEYETYMPDTKNLFLGEAARLTEWGCSRAYGLGTKLPFDDRFVIESLSDSTIYMAYYTIAHYLQSGPFDGRKQGSAGISADQMTDAVYDYIFRGAEFPAGCEIPQETLDKMRAEFEYWYNNGYDLRCSGKDLIGNHLTFSLYNHAAIFPDKMPRSCFTNGHVLMDGKKMSKSDGNFLTLEEAIGEYSADGARVTCANAGDSNEFANFERDVANSAVLELFKLEEKASTMLQDEHREGEMTWHDKMFAGDIEYTVNVTSEHFNGMRFREGLKTGFYEFLNMQARYKTWTGEQGMNKSLLQKYLQMQAMVLAPICPHTAEAIWAHGGGEGSIFDSRWPEKTQEFTKYHRASVFLTKFIQQLREQVEKSKKGKKPVEVSKAVVYVANNFNDIQTQVLTFLRNEYDTKGQIAPSFKGELQKVLTEGGLDKKAAGVALGFAAFIVKNFEEQGPDVLDVELPFNQKEVLEETGAFFQRELGLTLEIHDASTDCPDPKKKKSQAYPAAPQFYLE